MAPYILEVAIVAVVVVMVSAILYSSWDKKHEEKLQAAHRRAEQAAEDSRRHRVGQIAEQVRRIAKGDASEEVKVAAIVELVEHPNANITDRALVEVMLRGDGDPYPLNLFMGANQIVNPQNLEAARRPV